METCEQETSLDRKSGEGRIRFLFVEGTPTDVLALTRPEPLVIWLKRALCCILPLEVDEPPTVCGRLSPTPTSDWVLCLLVERCRFLESSPCALLSPPNADLDPQSPLSWNWDWLSSVSLVNTYCWEATVIRPLFPREDTCVTLLLLASTPEKLRDSPGCIVLLPTTAANKLDDWVVAFVALALGGAMLPTLRELESKKSCTKVNVFN